MLSETNGYTKSSDESTYISFLIKHGGCERYIVKSGIKSALVLKKRFDSEPVYKDKYFKTSKILWRNNKLQILKIMESQKKVLITFVY